MGTFFWLSIAGVWTPIFLGLYFRNDVRTWKTAAYAIAVATGTVVVGLLIFVAIMLIGNDAY